MYGTGAVHNRRSPNTKFPKRKTYWIIIIKRVRGDQNKSKWKERSAAAVTRQFFFILFLTRVCVYVWIACNQSCNTHRQQKTFYNCNNNNNNKYDSVYTVALSRAHVHTNNSNNNII